MFKKLFLILISLIMFFACGEQQEETVEEVSVPVKIYEVKKDTITQIVELTGSVEAENDAVIYAKVSEKINEIRVKVGDKVQKDQIIAIQHNDALKQSVETAKAAVKTAESQNKLAQSDFNRMKSLYDQKAVSPQQFDQSKTQLETAGSTLEQAQSQLAQAEEGYQNSLIKAPFSGTVAAIYFEENQMVNAGQAVAQVINPSTMKAKLTATGKDAAAIEVGQSVNITFPSLPGKVYKGKVVKMDQALDPMTNSLEVEVRIMDADKNIKSGLFGRFNVIIESKDNILVIPQLAVQQQTEIEINRKTGVQNSIRKYYVFSVEDSRAVLKEIKVGLESGSLVEVKGGLKEGGNVVIAGQNIVKNGDLVKIIE